MHSINPSPARRGRERLWIVETLVIVGVLALGYFAALQETSPSAPTGSLLSDIAR
jgi:hypothetical protein